MNKHDRYLLDLHQIEPHEKYLAIQYFREKRCKLFRNKRHIDRNRNINVDILHEGIIARFDCYDKLYDIFVSSYRVNKYQHDLRMQHFKQKVSLP